MIVLCQLKAFTNMPISMSSGAVGRAFKDIQHVAEWVFLPGFIYSRRRTFHLTSDSDWHQIAEMLPSSSDVDVIVDTKLCLKKRLKLPGALGKNLSKAVDLHIRQEMPAQAKDLLWSSMISRQNKTDLLVDVYIQKRAVIQRLEALLAGKKSRLRTVTISALNARGFLIDKRPLVDRARRWWIAGTIAALVLAQSAVLLRETQANQSLEADLATLLATQHALTEEALALKAKRDESRQSSSSVNSDLNVFKLEFQRLSILLELTEQLPDTTWISEFAIVGDALQLSGFTEDSVPNLISLFDAPQWTEQVEIASPITFDSLSRKNRFSLSITLANPSEEGS